MTWEIAQQILETYGLPMLGLIAVSWAWYRERQGNADLNAEVRENACEMTAALVSVKEVTDSFKDALVVIDERLQKCEKHIDQVTQETNQQLGGRLENIEKKLIELTTKLEARP